MDMQEAPNALAGASEGKALSIVIVSKEYRHRAETATALCGRCALSLVEVIRPRICAAFLAHVGRMAA